MSDPQPDRYRVEDLAEAADVAVDTVRYYQRRKLLAPPQKEGRVAWYDAGHLARLQEIRHLADEGFTLAQVGALSAKDAGGQLADLAAQHAADPDLDKAELARRAEVPEFIVDLVVGAGLLVSSSGEGDSARFPADAVDMLVAARTLVSEGVTLEELTALAMRHATHVEDVIDDAIELFKRHSDRRGGDRDELIGLMHRLVPVASDLVGRHFERTLLSRALARMGDDATGDVLSGGLVVLARKLDERVDPLAVFATAADPNRALWIRPDRDLALVGLGAVETIAPVGDGRFSAASAARAALAARVKRTGPSDAPAPVLVGGFSFSASGWGGPSGEAGRGPDWSGFPEAHWVLPELTFVDRLDGSWVLAAARVVAGESEEDAIDSLDRRIDALCADLPGPLTVDLNFENGEVSDEGATAAPYESMVADAVSSIAAGEFGKVVLARTHDEVGIDPITILARLRERYPGCAVFSLAVGPRHFLGASPEELVALDGRQVRTAALAGTTGVGWDETSDAGLASEMLNSAKIREEHQYVVDDITNRLAALGLVGETLAEPEVLRLARLQHLRTPITARIERRTGGVSDMDVLRVAGVLHPTPAVAGTPTAAAVNWLEAREAFDRGWYAAPVGWCDLDGNGELRVALRSALVDATSGHATLFSGAGIVADSVPADELTETGVKLRALLDVMNK
ncbi:MAG: isochorismate synthase [Acidimicrobiales bacterium]|nr:isochorismate synthase [Acidimicrobiales bacterium]